MFLSECEGRFRSKHLKAAHDRKEVLANPCRVAVHYLSFWHTFSGRDWPSRRGHSPTLGNLTRLRERCSGQTAGLGLEKGTPLQGPEGVLLSKVFQHCGSGTAENRLFHRFHHKFQKLKDTWQNKKDAFGKKIYRAHVDKAAKDLRKKNTNSSEVKRTLRTQNRPSTEKENGRKQCPII